MSASMPYRFPSSTSGAMVRLVPKIVPGSPFALVSSFANPKSAIFRIPVCLRMFASLRLE